MASRTIAAAIAIAALGAVAPRARAEEAATRAQVELLQKQLTAMQKEMEAMQKALSESEAKGNAAYPMMHQHMVGMQKHWRMMHDQTCTMAPATCPLDGSAKTPAR